VIGLCPITEQIGGYARLRTPMIMPGGARSSIEFSAVGPARAGSPSVRILRQLVIEETVQL
jgi:hypothetical protein